MEIYTQLQYRYSFMVVSLYGYATKPIDVEVAPSSQIPIYENSYLAPRLVGIKHLLLSPTSRLLFFIPPSLAAKYEFSFIEIGLLAR